MKSLELMPAVEVGKIVHLGVEEANQVLVPRAAITTAVLDDGLTISLAVFPGQVLYEFDRSGRFMIVERVPYSHTLRQGHWSWPPSVMLELQARLHAGK